MSTITDSENQETNKDESEKNESEVIKETSSLNRKDPKLIKQAIEAVVKKKGYTSIKANIDGYEQPTSFVNSSTGTEYIPDITAESYGNKSYFELAVKTDDERKMVNKWQLMKNLAAMKKGKFHLIAPKGHYAFAQRASTKYNINANIVKL